MQKPRFVQEDEAHKILGHFEIETDPIIQFRRLDQIFINKKTTCQQLDFVVPEDHRVKVKVKEDRQMS